MIIYKKLKMDLIKNCVLWMLMYTIMMTKQKKYLINHNWRFSKRIHSYKIFFGLKVWFNTEIFYILGIL